MQHQLMLTKDARESLNSLRFTYSDDNSAIVGLTEDRKELMSQVRGLENKNLKLTEFNDVLKESLAIEVEVLDRERWLNI